MAQSNPRFKYEFDINGQTFLLGIGQQATTDSGSIVKVHQYKKLPNGTHDFFMHILCISIDGGNWISLEYGFRVMGGKLREEFKKFRMVYPASSGSVGTKCEQISLWN